MGPVMFCGGIVGAFAGGTVTTGTAQMAYLFGISGIWFTLGGNRNDLALDNSQRLWLELSHDCRHFRLLFAVVFPWAPW
jgi:hypothetical protein